MNKTIFGNAQEAISKAVYKAIQLAKPLPRFPEDRSAPDTSTAVNCAYCGTLFTLPVHTDLKVFCSTECGCAYADIGIAAGAISEFPIINQHY